jgi:thiosulfate/3-mercaptopyruvate sulfurtransferase
MYTTLISTADLAAHLDDPTWAIVDCRFSLADKAAGRQGYLAGHIPGAVYAHLDEDLSGPILPGATGRHPLPTVIEFVDRLSHWGIDEKTQVVAYDDAGGMVAGRLWWMLRWVGQEAVAVLDGGWRQWQSEGRPATTGVETRAFRRYTPCVHPAMLVLAQEVLDNLDNPAVKLFDARAASRYRGEGETLDAKGGHIPGAISAPYAENLGPDGRFLPPDQLQARFQALLGDTTPEHAILYCGSGVSAAHNLLAMTHAGLPGARLYVGSWSEWITDPVRPIATGETPIN